MFGRRYFGGAYFGARYYGKGSGTAAPGASAAQIWAYALEGGLSAGSILRIILAAVAGRTTGVGTQIEEYLSVDGAKPRVTVSFDASSNRTTIVLDGSP